MLLILLYISSLPLAFGFNPFYWILTSQNGQAEPPQLVQPFETVQPAPFLDQLSPRFSNLFLKPFALTKNKQSLPRPNTLTYKDTPTVCKDFGGVLVGDECLQFFSEKKTYDDARQFCRSRNGDLYVPLQYEGFLFAKYFLYFPEAFNVGDGISQGWIGAKKDGPGMPVLTVKGDDVSKNAIYNLQPFPNDQCFHILMIDMLLAQDDCYSKKPFTCEYELSVYGTASKPTPKPLKNTNKFSFFNKFPSFYQ